MSRASLLDSRIIKYAYRDIDEVCRDIGTAPDGLTEEQAEEMRAKYGKNVFAVSRSFALWQGVRRAFINPFTVVLFVLALVSVFTDVIFVSDGYSRKPTTAAVIFIMILISGIIRLIQELKAKSAAEQLDRLIRENVSVKRGGKWVLIPAEEIVTGDLISISAGDRIPADIRLTNVNDLFISQAAITGESEISEKSARTMKRSESETLSKTHNLVFMATTVISGKGEGIVLAVGQNTLYGNFIRADRGEKNAFRKGANSIAGVLLKFIAVLVPIVFILLGVTGGRWLESLAFSLSVAVGLVPEMLPMVITACLAKGSFAMSKKQTIVKDINSMQSFGSMDILCMDKTGTLTNESIIMEYYMDILGNESESTLDAAYINSLYHTGTRNPVDNAILACSTMPGQTQHFAGLSEVFAKSDEIPFDHIRKIVSILVTDADGKNTLIMKGDVSSVFARCGSAEYKGEIIPISGSGSENAESVFAIVNEMMSDGMKVIAVAKKDMGDKTGISDSDERDMTLVGYLAFFDAPKSTAKDSVSKLKELKVTPKILTGDSVRTAVSVCKRVGISSEKVMTGSALDELTDAELLNTAESVSVFAELTPAQKVRIVSALRENGHSVGFLGDGINDIPVLNEADVGISVDTAVDAAKDAADVILLQKDLTVLQHGISEGRKTFTNMLKYIKITASSNFGNIFSIVCASAFLPFLPMASIQILLLNLLYDVLCIVLPWDNVDDEELKEPKKWSGKNLGRFMLSFGPISSLFDLATFFFLYFFLCPAVCGGALFTDISSAEIQQRYIALFQTGWFLESLWTQVLILNFLRTSKIPFIKSRPSLPVIFITVAGTLIFTLITFTDAAAFFGLTRLPHWYFGFLAVVAFLYMVLTSVVKHFYQKKYNELI